MGCADCSCKQRVGLLVGHRNGRGWPLCLLQGCDELLHPAVLLDGLGCPLAEDLWILRLCCREERIAFLPRQVEVLLVTLCLEAAQLQRAPKPLPLQAPTSVHASMVKDIPRSAFQQLFNLWDVPKQASSWILDRPRHAPLSLESGSTVNAPGLTIGQRVSALDWI